MVRDSGFSSIDPTIWLCLALRGDGKKFSHRSNCLSTSVALRAGSNTRDAMAMVAAMATVMMKILKSTTGNSTVERPGLGAQQCSGDPESSPTSALFDYCSAHSY